ncbi:hypothetical protein [Rhodococcus indonesiensis]|uniref:hypothetical protein n=1 Tax=Rhodococcus indonesiensis TaxID=3055869 RepID=UPI0039F71DF2
MTVKMPCFEGGDRVVEADGAAHLHLQAEHAHERFVKVVTVDGAIHLFPFAHLDAGERAVFENAELYADTKQALEAFTPDGGHSTDWMFESDDDDE